MSLLDLWFRKWEATCWNRRRGQTSRGEMTPCVCFCYLTFILCLTPKVVWFKDISSRPAWLAIKDADNLMSNYTY